MSTDIKQLKDELIFKAGYIAANIGLNKSMGQLYAALFLGQKPIPLDELAKICRMSKGNASINIRRLERWGAVGKVWTTENRKDYYEANRDILNFTLKHGMRVFSDRLSEGEDILGKVSKKIDYVDPSLLDETQKETMKTYQNSLNELVRIIGKLKGLNNNFKLFEKMLNRM